MSPTHLCHLYYWCKPLLVPFDAVHDFIGFKHHVQNVSPVFPPSKGHRALQPHGDMTGGGSGEENGHEPLVLRVVRGELSLQHLVDIPAVPEVRI